MSHSHNHEDLESAIIQWVVPLTSEAFINQTSTFEDLPDYPKNLESLSDGIVLTEIMNKMYNKLYLPMIIFFIVLQITLTCLRLTKTIVKIGLCVYII